MKGLPVLSYAKRCQESGGQNDASQQEVPSLAGGVRGARIDWGRGPWLNIEWEEQKHKNKKKACDGARKQNGQSEHPEKEKIDMYLQQLKKQRVSLSLQRDLTENINGRPHR